MNILEIVSAIVNNLTAGEEISNSRIPHEQIRDEVHTIRGSLIDELLRQGAKVPIECYVRMAPIPLEWLPITEVCIGLPSEYDVQTAKVPKIKNHPISRKPLIQFAGNMNRSLPYRILTGNQHLYFMEEKQQQVPCLWVEGSRVVVFDESALEVQIVGVPGNPDEWAEFEHCPYKEEEPYPADETMIRHIIGKLTDRYTRNFYRMNPIQRDGFRDTQGMEQAK